MRCEKWETLAPPFDKYKISSYGNVISPKGKLLKPYIQCYGIDKKCTRAICTLKIERKGIKIRRIIGVGTEVYRHFGNGYIDGVKVFHKDKNILNNNIENLFIADGYTTDATQEQQKRIQEIIPCVIHSLKILNLTRYRKYGLDIDNVIGEATFMCWLHLSQFHGNSFYAYCKKYVRFAFLHEYTKWKKYSQIMQI